MDDTPTLSLVSRDPSSGSMSISCIESKRALFFVTGEYLGSEESGTIQIRFDSEQPYYAASFLNNGSALLAYPNSNPAWDKQVQAQNASELFERLASGRHKRLRLRIPTAKGGSTDLSFDVSELGTLLPKMLEKCPAVAS